MANSSSLPSVFDYLDYRRYLADWIAAMRISYPKFSIRAFTLKAGLPISNSSFFSKVIAGNRNLTLDLRFRMTKALKLSPPESRYFDLLVQYNQSRDMDGKRHFYSEMARYRRSKARIIDKEGYEYYSAWRHSMVRAYFGMDQRQANPAAIGEHIFPPLDAKEVEASIDLLLRLGLIVRTANGFALRDRHIATARENKDFVGKVRIPAMMDLARDVFNHVPPSDREYGTLTMYISSKGYQGILERLAAFRQELKALVDQDSDEDRVYTFNFQFFPNTQLPEWTTIRRRTKG
jgi:uncharacterized protein (TIGR02147 family)